MICLVEILPRQVPFSLGADTEPKVGQHMLLEHGEVIFDSNPAKQHANQVTVGPDSDPIPNTS